jgi:putative heme-binding domain-containing protein
MGKCRRTGGRGQWLRAVALAICVVAPTVLVAAVANGKEAEWIWSPAYEKEQAPAGTCYFRKSFNLGAPEQGTIHIACDDAYELYVNGRLVGSGDNWKSLDVYDVTKMLVQGQNTVAVKAVNSDEGSAGLVARVVVKQKGGTHVEHSTNGTWKTSLKEFSDWQKPRFTENQWLAARSFGALNATLPWGNEVTVAGSDGRFKVTPEFLVEWVVDPQETGSLTCMTFDEFGQIIAARENGPLIRIRDNDRDGLVETVSILTEEVKNCQGLLAVSGKLYAVGDGPQGPALYCLADEDHDGEVDQIDAILKFTGEMGEHGPHAVTLGPDGFLYLLIGNFSRSAEEYEASSPYHDYYEGDLITPRYEDASGHAVGIKAPGGTIIRCNIKGEAPELVAGGLQNPYDLVFNGDGELFTADSDMEWDSGMPWYRPTRLVHVSPGAEFGWRSGWSKWPIYFPDSLPPTLELGRGSPAGLECYDHFMFPKRYHDALFVCDWSRGRILAIRGKRHGATYRATAEVFLEGQPLNATDIAVGPDGWLYFCTGGRDTEGGVYRIVWTGKIPPEVLNRPQGIAGALEQPQLTSAWARQRVALVKQTLGNAWAPQLIAVAKDPQAPEHRRVRALQLMQLFGPYPPTAVLLDCSRDRSAKLRAKSAYLMGIHANDQTAERLTQMLDDKDFGVARAATEALTRAGQLPPAEKLVGLLSSPDRYLGWAAMRGLERIDSDQWADLVIENTQPRVFNAGAIALLVQDPEPQTIDAILDRGSQLLKGYLTDDEFLEILRVFELALMKGEVEGDSVPQLRAQLAEEYPSRDLRMNRELVRLLVYLQDPTFAKRLVEQLNSDLPDLERMQLLVHAPFLKTGWRVPLKLEVLKAYEDARTMDGGKSFAGYIENVSRDFFALFDEEDRKIVLSQGAKWPSSALSVLAKLPENPSAETLAEIEKLDRQVKKLDAEAAKRLRIGICAVLGASGNANAMAYLRELYESEPDRRVSIAMALAQQPEGENWPLLVRSLSIVEGAAAQEILTKLAAVDRKPEEPEAYRQVILRGLLLREHGSRRAVELLEKWSGEQHSEPNDAWDTAMTAWQGWFGETYPDLPDAKLPADLDENHWTYQELLSYLTGPQGSRGVASRGAALFESAQCAKCHRFGERGDSVGPDLTNVAKRFQRKEILESILFPSQTISDQFASQTVVTNDGKTYVGMVAPSGNGALVVLQANGEKMTIPEDEVESRTRAKVSSMPQGLLNRLSIEEVADLFAYLSGRGASDLADKSSKGLTAPRSAVKPRSRVAR